MYNKSYDLVNITTFEIFKIKALRLVVNIIMLTRSDEYC